MNMRKLKIVCKLKQEGIGILNLMKSMYSEFKSGLMRLEEIE